MGGIENGPVDVEILRDLIPGESVTLPDGERAVVEKQVRDDVYVVQPQKVLGRGPWVFARWQLDACGGAT